jgi:hypothetical protein
VTVRDRSQRSPDPGLLEEQCERRHHNRGDDRGGDVDFLQCHETAGHLDVDCAARQAQLFRDHDLRFAAEHQFAETDQEICQAERRHEQDDVRLIDQRPQHQPLNREGEAEHHGNRQCKRDIGRNAVFMQPDQRKRREHHHDALGEIEDSGSLEDQHEAECDQRIEHAGHQALPQGLHQQIGRGAHLHERIDEDFIEGIHRDPSQRRVRQCATPR